MKMSAINARRVLAGVFAGCAVCAGISIALPTAGAQPGQCTAAGLAHTISGVTGRAGDYLDSNPDANQAITGAGSETPDQAQANLRGYFASHMKEYNDLKGLAQPLTDLRTSCNQNVSAAQIAALLQAFASPL